MYVSMSETNNLPCDILIIKIIFIHYKARAFCYAMKCISINDQSTVSVG